MTSINHEKVSPLLAYNLHQDIFHPELEHFNSHLRIVQHPSNVTINKLNLVQCPETWCVFLTRIAVLSLPLPFLSAQSLTNNGHSAVALASLQSSPSNALRVIISDTPQQLLYVISRTNQCNHLYPSAHKKTV